jgi:hypothetical protein
VLVNTARGNPRLGGAEGAADDDDDGEAQHECGRHDAAWPGYVASLACMAPMRRCGRRRLADRSAPAAVGPVRVVLLALVTHKISRFAAKDAVTSPRRAAMTKFRGGAGAAELHQDLARTVRQGAPRSSHARSASVRGSARSSWRRRWRRTCHGRSRRSSPLSEWRTSCTWPTRSCSSDRYCRSSTTQTRDGRREGSPPDRPSDGA